VSRKFLNFLNADFMCMWKLKKIMFESKIKALKDT